MLLAVHDRKRYVFRPRTVTLPAPAPPQMAAKLVQRQQAVGAKKASAAAKKAAEAVKKADAKKAAEEKAAAAEAEAAAAERQGRQEGSGAAGITVRVPGSGRGLAGTYVFRLHVR